MSMAEAKSKGVRVSGRQTAWPKRCTYNTSTQRLLTRMSSHGLTLARETLAGVGRPVKLVGYY